MPFCRIAGLDDSIHLRLEVSFFGLRLNVQDMDTKKKLFSLLTCI